MCAFPGEVVAGVDLGIDLHQPTDVEQGRVASIMAFHMVDGRIVALDVLADPARLTTIDASWQFTGGSITPGADPWFQS